MAARGTEITHKNKGETNREGDKKKVKIYGYVSESFKMSKRILFNSFFMFRCLLALLYMPFFGWLKTRASKFFFGV